MTDPTQEHALLGVAQAAARAAATELQARFGHLQPGIRTKSTPTDLVSDADVAAESAIRAVLAEQRPDDAILAEEGGASGAGELRWIVDPLDGTSNFLSGIPTFAVSIACEDRDGMVAGVVLDPIREECFAATRSGVPTLNGVPITASGCQDLSSALVATGFAYEAQVRARQGEVLAQLLPRVRDIRRAGAAALDLSWTAGSRYDAYYERGLNPWDRAAGVLIASRAGLSVRELEATEAVPGGVVVAPDAIIDELYGLVAGG